MSASSPLTVRTVRILRFQRVKGIPIPCYKMLENDMICGVLIIRSSSDFKVFYAKKVKEVME